MLSAAFVISVCCPHFADKSGFLTNLAREVAKNGVLAKIIVAGQQSCPHIIRLHEDRQLCRNTFEGFVRALPANTDNITCTNLEADSDLEHLVDISWDKVSRDPPDCRRFEGYWLQKMCAASVARRLQGSSSAESGAGTRAACDDEYQKDAMRHLLFIAGCFLVGNRLLW